MIRSRLLLPLVLLNFLSCTIQDGDIFKTEIEQIEKDFEKMSAEKGLAQAFYFFAADSAVIHRRDSLIVGKEAIKHFYDTPAFQNVKLQWTPDYIEVSNAGDLAYAYGKYLFQSTDTTGAVNESRGVYMTVWKKQEDNTWRFVWD